MPPKTGKRAGEGYKRTYAHGRTNIFIYARSISALLASINGRLVYCVLALYSWCLVLAYSNNRFGDIESAILTIFPANMPLCRGSGGGSQNRSGAATTCLPAWLSYHKHEGEQHLAHLLTLVLHNGEGQQASTRLGQSLSWVYLC